MDLNISLKKLIERRKEIEIARQSIHLKGHSKKPANISPYLSDELLINSPGDKTCRAKCCSKQNVHTQIKFNADTRKVSSDEIFNDHRKKCPKGKKKRKSVLTIPSVDAGKRYEVPRPGKRDVANIAADSFNDDGARALCEHESRCRNMKNIARSRLWKREIAERELAACREKEERGRRTKARSRLRGKVPTEKSTRNKSPTLPMNSANCLYQSRNQGGERVFVFNRKADAGDNGGKRRRKRRGKRRDERDDARRLAANNSPQIRTMADIEMWRRVCEPGRGFVMRDVGSPGSTVTNASPTTVLYRRVARGLDTTPSVLLDEERSSMIRTVRTDSPIETQVSAARKRSRAMDCTSMVSSSVEDISDDEKHGGRRNRSIYPQHPPYMNRTLNKLHQTPNVISCRRVTKKETSPIRKLERNPVSIHGTPLLLSPRNKLVDNLNCHIPNKFSKNANTSTSVMSKFKIAPLNKGRSNAIAKHPQPTAEKKLQFEGVAITFPLVIMEENEVSSTIHVPDYEAPQFYNAGQIWPFMKKWECDWEKVAAQKMLRKRFDRARSLNFFREKMESLRDKSAPWYGRMRANRNIVELDESCNGSASTRATTALVRRKPSAVSSDRTSAIMPACASSRKSCRSKATSPVKSGGGDSVDDLSSGSELSKSTIRHKLSHDLLDESSSNEPKVTITEKQLDQDAKSSDSAETPSVEGCGEGDAAGMTAPPDQIKLSHSCLSFSKSKGQSDNSKETGESKHIIIENPSTNYHISFEIMDCLSEETRTTDSSISVEISYEGLGSSQSLMVTASKLELLSSNLKTIDSPLTQNLSSQSCCWTSKTVDTLDITPETSDDSRGKVAKKISSMASINLDLTSLLMPDKHDKLADCADQIDSFPLLSSNMSCVMNPYTFMLPMPSMSNVLSRSDKRKTSCAMSTKRAVRPVGNHSESAIRKKIKNVNAIGRKYDKPIKNKVIKLASLPCCTPYTNKGNFNTTSMKMLDARLHDNKLANMFSSRELTEIIFNSLRRYEFATLPKNEIELGRSAVITKKSLFISREILNGISPVIPQMLKSYSSLNVRGNLRLTISRNKFLQSNNALEINTAADDDEDGTPDNGSRHDANVTPISTSDQECQLSTRGLINLKQVFSATYQTTEGEDSKTGTRSPMGTYSTPEVLQNKCESAVIMPKQKSKCPFRSLRRKWRERRRILEKISGKQSFGDGGDARGVNDVSEYKLADIKSSADFFRIIGMASDSALLIAYEGLSEKLMKAVEELERWTSRLTRPQALLTFVLACRAGGGPAAPYPALLREIAAGEVATGAELERRVRLIDEAVQMAKDEKTKENVLKSPEFYGTIVEKLCLAAGTEALNNSTSLSPEAENLLKLIAQRKLEPQIEYLRQLARYVGRGLFASS